MTTVAVGAFYFGATNWRHGLRLAIAVVAAFGLSTVLGLPESFWAVMSALIVVRPTTGSALGAGWDRVRGTMSGTAIGLAGVWLHHVVLGPDASTLVTIATVAIVAFASAIVPTLRSAPISALIVLTSSGITGHSALDVAALRAVEIAIGVATGIVVSLVAFAAHARSHFVAESVAWLRTTARHAVDDLASGTPDAAVREQRRDATRRALRAIAELAVSADRESRWLARVGRATHAIDHVACARAMTRVSSDVAAMVRAAGCAPMPLEPAARVGLATALDDALQATADALQDGRSPRQRFANLKRWSSPTDAPAAWLAAPSRLLLQDLDHLSAMTSRVEVPQAPTAIGPA